METDTHTIRDADVVDSTAEDVSIDGEQAAAGTELERVEVVQPRTGEIVDLRALEPVAFAELVAFADDLTREALAFRKALTDEGARRLDRRNVRKDRFGEFELETNAPSRVDYREDVLERVLRDLVAAGVIEAPVFDKIFVQPPMPTEPPPRKLDKRELNKLKNNEAAAAAIASASVRTGNTRSLKISRKGGAA